MTDIIWEDPPRPDAGRLGDPELEAFAASLRANPQNWARYPRHLRSPATAAGNIKRGRQAAFGPGFEATTRTVEGETRLYVRYVGEEAS